LPERLISAVRKTLLIFPIPGPAPVSMDLRYDTALINMGAIGSLPTEGNLGVSGAERIKVGTKEESLLWLRLTALDLDDLTDLIIDSIAGPYNARLGELI
jgi:hypothetical protein